MEDSKTRWPEPLSLYVGVFGVILGVYTLGSRRIPAVEPLVAGRVLILGCKMASKSLRSLWVWVLGVMDPSRPEGYELASKEQRGPTSQCSRSIGS